MLRRNLATLAFLAAALVAAPVIAQTAGDSPMSTPSSTGKVPVGGAEIHYEIHGDGPRDAGLDGSQRPASQLAIIPNTTHYSLIQSPLLTEVATAFLTQ